MWQTKIKDIDLLFISMQALIPTLGYEEKSKNIPLENKKEKNKNYTEIKTYKPTGNLIYSNELLKKVTDSINK